MRAGLTTRDARYSVTGRAWHGWGTAPVWTVAVVTGAVSLSTAPPIYLIRAALSPPWRPPVIPPSHGLCWPFPNLYTAMRPLCMGHRPGSRIPCGQTVDLAVPGERVDRGWIGAHRQQDPQCSKLRAYPRSAHTHPPPAHTPPGRNRQHTSQRINYNKLLIVS